LKEKIPLLNILKNKMNKKLSCTIGLEKNIISKTIFNREIKLCKMLSEEKKGCGWGKCKNCGVLPLLVKLHKGKLVEDKKEIEELKNKLLNY